MTPYDFPTTSSGAPHKGASVRADTQDGTSLWLCHENTLTQQKHVSEARSWEGRNRRVKLAERPMVMVLSPQTLNRQGQNTGQKIVPVYSNPIKHNRLAKRSVKPFDSLVHSGRYFGKQTCDHVRDAAFF